MLTSDVKYPKAIVLVNGIRVAWFEIEVTSNGNYQSDCFRVDVPIQAQQPQVTLNWWNQQDQLDVEIYMGYVKDQFNYNISDLDLIIMGSVDNFSHDFIEKKITLSGRDYTSLLIDTKTTNKWPDRKASDIVTTLAKKYNLTPRVTKTKTKIDVYYRREHVRMQINETEWDLICWLARKEGFEPPYIIASDLYFQPKPTKPLVFSIECQLDANGIAHLDGKRMVFERNLSLARDITVIVKSANWQHPKGFYKTAKAGRNSKGLYKSKFNNKPQVYTYNKPGLTPEAALQLAQQKANEIAAHQVKMQVTGIPGDNNLTPRHIIQLTGTDVYDQKFYPDSIVRRMTIEEGYVMDVNAKNHDVNTEVPMVGVH